MPEHPECDSAGRPVMDSLNGDESATVAYAGCPGGTSRSSGSSRPRSNTLLWVQVRADSPATAYQVLDSIRTHGL